MVEIRHLQDARIDQLTPNDKTQWGWDLWRQQLDYAVLSRTPAIQKLMKQHGLTLSDFREPADLRKFPIITKRTFREHGYEAFLPEKYRAGLTSGYAKLEHFERFHPCSRFTGGTLTRAVSDFTLIKFSNSDWLGHMQSSTRAIQQQNRDIQFPRNVFVNYMFDHISAPFFTGIIMHNGGHYTPRHLNLSNRDAFEMLKRLRCDGIITPPAANRLKGHGLVELLAGDTDIHTPYITSDNIKMIIVSSMPLTERVYQLAQRRGIPVKDLGGATDIGIALANCTEDPFCWHSIEGSVLNEVVDRAGNPAGDGEQGLFVSSRIAGVVDADPFLTTLYHDIQQIATDQAPSRHFGVEPIRRVSNIIGRDVQSLSCQALAQLQTNITREYEAAQRIVANQATQLLRFSGLMNETQYFAPHECACGKYTVKMKELVRTYDFDGKPEDLRRPAVILENGQTSRPTHVSAYQMNLPNSCQNGII